MKTKFFIAIILLATAGYAAWRYVYYPLRDPSESDIPDPVEMSELPTAPDIKGQEPEVPRQEADIPDMPKPPKPSQAEDCIHGESILEMAKLFQQHEWNYVQDTSVLCGAELSFFKPNRTYKGVAYKWGGLDGTQDFNTHLLDGKKPGSYSNEGVISCATGIDCSGLIGYCWGIANKKYGTSTIHQISVDLEDSTFNIATDLKRGDALNLRGKHIVLYDTIASNGKAIIYEATGGRIRKVRKTERDWRWFIDKGYKPIRYEKLCQ